MKLLALASLTLLICQLSFAQSKRFRVYKQDSEERVTLKNNRPLSLFYEKPAWNQNQNLVESGYIYIFDKDTGKLMEMKLTETEPNSAVFNVDLPIGTLKKDKIKAEMYSAPMSMLEGKNTGDRADEVESLLEKKALKRKPFLLRVLRRKGQIIDVFDTKEDALAAYKKYKKQLGIADTESDSIIEMRKNEQPEQKKFIDTSTLQSMFLANESSEKANNDKNKELRDVLMKVEKERREGVKANEKQWPQSKVENNKQKAKNEVKDAVSTLQAKNFEKSREHFFNASDLIPHSEDTYEQYGVALHREGKYNHAIVVLTLAESSQTREAEKQFYLGMSYYKLLDYENAIAHFNKVMELNDKSFGPTAAFYKGTALIEMKEFDKSKDAFQYVLDHSKNPDMDKRAEKYIEYSIDQKQIEKKRSSKFWISGVFGLSYDSNIILATDAARDQGGVRGEGVRALASTELKYRPYYDPDDEIAVKLNLTALQSFDTGFAQDNRLTQADPWLGGVKVPWTHRATLLGKGYFFDLTPGYEAIWMDLDNTGKKVILRTTSLDFNNTIVATKNFVAKVDYNFDMNNSSALGDETSADSIAYGFLTSGIWIVNKDLERYAIPAFGFSVNDAKSPTYAFSRLDLSFTFTSALFDMFIWSNKIGYFLANYESNRVDNNYSVSSSLAYHISPNWDWGIMAGYTLNDSNTNHYDKYTVLSTLSFSY
ncbi:MAG: tetratricopeptide repeat protein [Bdellovibrionales bacterium]|nr:tetratricopeptide repeat protein [Bdellovibrionales bacterium]